MANSKPIPEQLRIAVPHPVTNRIRQDSAMNTETFVMGDSKESAMPQNPSISAPNIRHNLTPYLAPALATNREVISVDGPSIPNTAPICDAVAPLNSASYGKTAGKREGKTPRNTQAVIQ